MKNWFGLECHPTDSMIHWSSTTKQINSQVETLRPAYDKIVAAGLLKELKILLDAKWQEGNDSCQDSHSDL